MNTRAPSRASKRAVARPMPEAPPVTITLRFCISIAVSVIRWARPA
jgi:hypothetical protein